MKSKLPTLPYLPSVACQYCCTMSAWQKDHESELRALARGLCHTPQRSRIFDFLAAYLDRVDHRDLGPKRQLEIINAIHEETGCSCLDRTVSLINDSIIKPSASSSSIITSDAPSTSIITPDVKSRSFSPADMIGKNFMIRKVVNSP